MIRSLGSVRYPAYGLQSIAIASMLSFCLQFASGCSQSKEPDPHAKYDEIALKEGMTKRDLIEALGEPDSYDYYMSDGNLGQRGGVVFADKLTKKVELLSYGPFGSYHPKTGDVTKYRLVLTFLEGQLEKWSRAQPKTSSHKTAD